jgi:segregation and condensation protein B
MNDESKLQQILEGLLLAAGKPLSLDQLSEIFTEEERPDTASLKAALDAIANACEGRGFELSKVASGYRFQVRQQVGEWVGRLWEEKPQKYSRALLETMAIIAYRQPLTRGDIEKIRGVAVNTQIMRTLLDREWVRVVGHRDVPGRPAMYATTRMFLDYFNLDNLDQLPALAEIRDMDEVNRAMNKELTLDAQPSTEGRVLELPQGEEADEEYVVLDEADEAVVACATQPLSSILGENREEQEIQESESETDETRREEASSQEPQVVSEHDMPNERAAEDVTAESTDQDTGSPRADH